jgi:hypothetical protein
VINQLFTLSSTIERLRQGPLNEYLDAYATDVAAQGYGSHSIRQQVAVIADLSRWLKQKDFEARDLDSAVVDRFLQLRRSQHRVRRGDRKTLERLLAMLCQTGVVRQQQAVETSAHGKVVSDFRDYLLHERGLSQEHFSTTFP